MPLRGKLASEWVRICEFINTLAVPCRQGVNDTRCARLGDLVVWRMGASEPHHRAHMALRQHFWSALQISALMSRADASPAAPGIPHPPPSHAHLCRRCTFLSGSSPTSFFSQVALPQNTAHCAASSGRKRVTIEPQRLHFLWILSKGLIGQVHQ